MCFAGCGKKKADETAPPASQVEEPGDDEENEDLEETLGFANCIGKSYNVDDEWFFLKILGTNDLIVYEYYEEPQIVEYEIVDDELLFSAVVEGDEMHFALTFDTVSKLDCAVYLDLEYIDLICECEAEKMDDIDVNLSSQFVSSAVYYSGWSDNLSEYTDSEIEEYFEMTRDEIIEIADGYGPMSEIENVFWPVDVTIEIDFNANGSVEIEIIDDSGAALFDSLDGTYQGRWYIVGYCIAIVMDEGSENSFLGSAFSFIPGDHDYIGGYYNDRDDFNFQISGSVFYDFYYYLDEDGTTRVYCEGSVWIDVLFGEWSDDYYEHITVEHYGETFYASNDGDPVYFKIVDDSTLMIYDYVEKVVKTFEYELTYHGLKFELVAGEVTVEIEFDVDHYKYAYVKFIDSDSTTDVTLRTLEYYYLTEFYEMTFEGSEEKNTENLIIEFGDNGTYDYIYFYGFMGNAETPTNWDLEIEYLVSIDFDHPELGLRIDLYNYLSPTPNPRTLSFTIDSDPVGISTLYLNGDTLSARVTSGSNTYVFEWRIDR